MCGLFRILYHESGPLFVVDTRMLRPLLVITLSILSGSVAVAQQPRTAKDTARQYFIDGTALQMQGNRHAEAILEFQQALRYDSAAPTLTAMARSYYELRKLTIAEEVVRQSLRKDASARDAWELLAEVLISNGKYDEGIVAYEHVLKLKPSRRQLYTMGRLYEPRNATKAIEVFEQLAAIEPSVALYMRIAVLHERLRNPDKRIKALERACDLESDNVQAAKELVEAYVKQGRLDDAVALSRKWYSWNKNGTDTRVVWSTMLQSMVDDSLLVNLYIDTVKAVLLYAEKSFPTDAYVLTLSGAIALDINDDTPAHRRLNAAALLVSDRAEGLLQIAALYATRNRLNEAKLFLEKWRHRYPLDPRFCLFIADCLMRLEKEDDAEMEFYAALDIDSTIVDAWLQIALINENRKEIPKSMLAYEKVLEFDPDNIVANNNFAYSITTSGGDLNQAREMSHKALQQNPTNAAYLDTYAWVLFKLGDVEKALIYIKQAVEYGGNATHYEHWGDILEASGDIDGAVRAWTDAIDRDPSRTYLRTRIDRFR